LSTIIKQPLTNTSNSFYLPHELTHPKPEVRLWLTQYEIDKQELENNHIYYGAENTIIFPIYLDKQLLGVQTRFFNSTRKYTIKGNKLQMSIASLKGGEKSVTLIFVEDILSAIKLSKYCNAIPLFGTYIPLELILRYQGDYKSFKVWLDPDKKKEALKQALMLKAKGFNITPELSFDKDPKEVSHKELEVYFKQKGLLP